MAYWRLYYHLIWATKERLPMISAEIEPELYGYIFGKTQALECIVHALGGIENHVHVAVAIPPKLSIAEFVQKIKGSSAYHINHSKIGTEAGLVWQRGYGAFSLGSKNLEPVVQYVRRQKQRHRDHSLIPALARDLEEDEGPVIWNGGKDQPENKFSA